ncbi:MAG TPA: (2Fe-2S)-binding protein [Phycisphaerae bacterium]|nr:(2Fe-2S)-binding protein [Phycisphaerae bacterium]
MNLDDQICFCYHVSLRKLTNFARRERPQRASQMSNCLGAGTGCGWCIPILKRIYESALSQDAPDAAASTSGLPATADDYAAGRREYLKSEEKNAF